MRILFCGDRDWTDVEKISQAFDDYLPKVVIEGEARGADTLARLEAERRGIPYLRFPADWDQYGRSAGPIRNKQMLVEGKPDLVLAFHSDIENSKGTANMKKQAEAAGVQVIVIP